MISRVEKAALLEWDWWLIELHEPFYIKY